MRIVLDTNVLVAGLLSPYGPPAQILQALLAGRVTVCFDLRIVSEYRQVLARPKFAFAPQWTDELLAWIEHSGERIIAPSLPLTLPDPDDAMFLEVAAAGRVDHLVTGNLRHFPAKQRAGVSVVRPAELVAKL